MHEWCVANGIEGDQRDDFLFIIPRLDKTYLEWVAKQNKQ